MTKIFDKMQLYTIALR